MIHRSNKKTDNTGLDNKVYLRKEATEHLESLRVLDLFAGENRLWSTFEKEKYYGVEMEKGKGSLNLYADNLKIIPSLDLSKFNVIDCDSYGMPVKQIEALYRNNSLQKGTVIVYTCIGSALSGVNAELLETFGVSEMYKKIKVLINKKGTELFYGYLYHLGVKEVCEYEKKDNVYVKRYGYFIV